MSTLVNSITDKFSFSINNQHATKSVRVALLCGNASPSNAAAMTSLGYPADALLADGTATYDSASVVMGCPDSSKTIKHSIQYLKHNPRNVKKITIVADDAASFNTSMSLASINPFHKEAEREIDLAQFFSRNQYQADRIEMEYANGELQFNDCLFWAISVPAATTMQIIVEFYND